MEHKKFTVIENMGPEIFISIFPSEKVAKEYFADALNNSELSNGGKDNSGNDLKKCIAINKADLFAGTIEIVPCEYYEYKNGEKVIHFIF